MSANTDRAPASSQETLQNIKKVHHSSYRSNQLNSAREAVIEDLGSSVPQVELEYILDHIIRYNGVDVIKTESNLLDSGCLLPETGWSKFTTSPPKNETETFAPLKDIREQILQHVVYFDPHNVNTATLNYCSEPNKSPKSTRYNTSRPDGYGHLSKAHPYSTSLCRVGGASKVDWLDIGYAEEYKKSDTLDNLYDNAAKILWSLQHIMRNDPRRRYTFGITIEDSNTRLWFCCRSLVVVSTPFDFMKEPRKFIRLVTSLSLATTTQLGWDPTMKLIRGPGTSARNIWAYDIEVRKRDDNGNTTTQIYRTEDVLSDFSADAIRGRATRVFKVRLLDQNGGVVGDPVVLKDVWLDADRPNEADILKKILEGCSDEERKYFLTILAYGRVTIDGRDDHTTNLGSESPTHPDLRIKAEPTVLKFDSNKHHSDSVGSSQINSSVEAVEIKYPKISEKVHTRIVYKEVCIPLYKIRSIKQLFLSLKHAVEGLEIMYRKRYVHRDISPGNILFQGDQGKLSDLEYAIPKGSGGKHKIRTGTVDFMAVEIEAGRYMFDGPNLDQWNVKDLSDLKSSGNPVDTPELVHNYLHDLESIWWVGMWSLAWYCPEQNFDNIPEAILQQHSFAQGLFSHIAGKRRSDFFMSNLIFKDSRDFLPVQFQSYLRILGGLRMLLLDSYKAHLVGNTVHEEMFTEIHSKFGAILDLVQELEDVTICPLPPIKRPGPPTTTGDKQHDPQSSKRQKQG